MKLGSLFSGIGGLELGLELALGCEIVWQVEREPWPRAVLARHWPDADRTVRDVTQPGGLFGSHYTVDELAPVDIICGGFPCQDISPAGSGKGVTDGKKSGLWRDFERVLRRLRPSYVIVENSHMLPHRGLDVVLGDLAALGYDAQWARIGAVDVGAPHRRWRCFIVAFLPDAVGLGCGRGAESGHRQPRAHGEAQQLADSDSRRRIGQRVAVAPHLKGPQRDEPNRCGAPVADTDGDGLHQPEVDEVRTRRHEPILPPSGRSRGRDAVPSSQLRSVADGLPTWLGDGPLPRAIAGPELRSDGRAALRALGNAVVPQVAFEVGLWLRRIIEDGQ